MQLGIFGGTFDPIHLGHLIMAEQCREQAGLDQVWFVPAARPPQKLGRSITPFAQRVEMLALAIAGNPAFLIDELENQRPGPSFTVDTLEELKRRHLRDELWLILGADALNDLPNWREPARLLDLAGLLIVARPGSNPMTAEEIAKAAGRTNPTPPRFQVVAAPLIEISSRDLRHRLATGQSVRYQLPRAVECYAEQHRVYANSSDRPLVSTS